MKLIYGANEGGHFSGWIAPEQASSNYEAANIGDSETPDHLFRTERLESILRDLGRKPTAQPHAAVIHCGKKPQNASTNCQVGKAPCLFNITSDPCEYNNLAHQMPQIVAMLEARLSKYEATMVKPRNKPEDPAGDPKLWGGVWTPWVNLTDVRHEDL